MEQHQTSLVGMPSQRPLCHGNPCNQRGSIVFFKTKRNSLCSDIDNLYILIHCRRFKKAALVADVKVSVWKEMPHVKFRKYFNDGQIKV
jgi:hypothetical protein